MIQTSKRPIQSPPTRSLIGHASAMLNDPLNFFKDTTQEYGGIVRLRLGHIPAILISKPEYVKHVLQDNYRNYIRGSAVDSARLMLGNGVALVDGDSWLQQRRLLQPAFHRKQIAAMIQTMVDATAEKLTEWQGASAGKQQIDFAQEMTQLTLHTAARTMFGADISPYINELETAFHVGQKFIYDYARNPLSAPIWMPTRTNRQFKQSMDSLDRIVYKLIRQRRPIADQYQDLLSMLLLAKDEETGEGMNEKQLRDEVVTMFLAGHETTTSALTWILYQMLMYPDLAQPFHDEVKNVLNGSDPRIETIQALSYADRFISETLRLYPPTWMFARESVSADEIDGYEIPAGISIFVSPYATHHDPTVWPDPETFNPERFDPTLHKQPSRFEYYPFGGGPHLCIGNVFALTQAKVIISMISQRYKLSLAFDKPISLLAKVSIMPQNGLWVTVQAA